MPRSASISLEFRVGTWRGDQTIDRLAVRRGYGMVTRGVLCSRRAANPARLGFLSHAAAGIPFAVLSTPPEKGKPAVRAGRKAMGPACRTARLPGAMNGGGERTWRAVGSMPRSSRATFGSLYVATTPFSPNGSYLSTTNVSGRSLLPRCTQSVKAIRCMAASRPRALVALSPTARCDPPRHQYAGDTAWSAEADQAPSPAIRSTWSRGSYSAAVEALAHGALAYIPKPFTIHYITTSSRALCTQSPRRQ